MPTGEWNDFGESFFGLLKLVAAALTRLPRKNPDADVCRDQSSLTFSGSHNADIRACTGAPRHKPNSMERAPKNCKDYYDRQALPVLRRSPLQPSFLHAWASSRDQSRATPTTR